MFIHCVLDIPLCSHLIVNLYYAESIISKDFVASKCGSVWDPIFGWCNNKGRNVTMGEHCDQRYNK